MRSSSTRPFGRFIYRVERIEDRRRPGPVGAGAGGLQAPAAERLPPRSTARLSGSSSSPSRSGASAPGSRRPDGPEGAAGSLDLRLVTRLEPQDERRSPARGEIGQHREPVEDLEDAHGGEERPYSEARASAGMPGGSQTGPAPSLLPTRALFPPSLAACSWSWPAPTPASTPPPGTRRPSSWSAAGRVPDRAGTTARPPVGDARGSPLLAAFAAWSYLSITWASQPGLAWDEANRTRLPGRVRPVRALAHRLARGQGSARPARLRDAGSGWWSAEGDSSRSRWPIHRRSLRRARRLHQRKVALWTLGAAGLRVLGQPPERARPLRAAHARRRRRAHRLALMGQSRGWVAGPARRTRAFVLVTPGPGAAAGGDRGRGGGACSGPRAARGRPRRLRSPGRSERVDDARRVLIAAPAARAGRADVGCLVERRVAADRLGGARPRGAWSLVGLVVLGLLVAAAPSGRIGSGLERLQGGGLGRPGGRISLRRRRHQPLRLLDRRPGRPSRRSPCSASGSRTSRWST